VGGRGETLGTYSEKRAGLSKREGCGEPAAGLRAFDGRRQSEGSGGQKKGGEEGGEDQE